MPLKTLVFILSVISTFTLFAQQHVQESENLETAQKITYLEAKAYAGDAMPQYKLAVNKI